jgi:polysaccharide pyruvyl transferase WcaK-like protein
MKKVLITGYYKKQNTGDDLFEKLANKLFNMNKNYKITILSIDNIKNDVLNISKSFDFIILFGGETLNEYFLKPLSVIKTMNQNIKLFALGVGLGADIDLIKHYILMFQYIVVRHISDLEIINNTCPNISCKYVQDIVFMYNIKYYKFKENKLQKTIGFFLSQPKYKSNGLLLNSYINLMKEYINKGYHIKLFSMCYSESISESDLFVNKDILNKIDSNNNITLVHNDDMETELLKLKYAICERFHAHILCIIYNIPFISWANTLKAKKLLIDLNLGDLIYESMDYNEVNNKLKSIDTNKLKNIYKKIYPEVDNFYTLFKKQEIDNNKIIIHQKYKTQLFITNEYINDYCNKLIKSSNKIPINNRTNYILMNLFGRVDIEYKWGLEQKINSNININNDIKWLFEQSILKYNFIHNILSNNIIVDNGYLNIDYIDQYDRTGVHRHGWKYVVDNISFNLCSFNTNLLKCDLYIDRTFHWNKQDMIDAHIIPYKTPWIGFIHHTLYQDESGYNSINLLKCEEFLESLKCCKGLIVLSKYLKNNLIKFAKINNIILPNIHVLYHPTELNVKQFNYNNWKGEIIQVGTWMRDINAIFDLKYNKKYALIGKQMENKYISYNPSSNNYNNINKKDYNVNLINFLDNDEYDNLLSKYVVFLKLYDASAVNTLIECIARNTPIIINKLPAIVEYLGNDYPLYYNDIDEVPLLLKTNLFHNKIKKAHSYLLNMNKTHIHIDTFIKNLKKII